MSNGVQGIQLPVEVQISNLQEVAKQLKQFANTNIIANSSGGKKVTSELDKILGRLDSISAKSKTAFTTQSNFTSVEKDIAQVELSLNKIRSSISNLNFEDIKIPTDVLGQIEALQGRIKELNGSLTLFKGTQKEKLINNQDFLNSLNVAEPTKAAKMLEQGYDDLYTTIQVGMGKVNGQLALANAEYKRQQEGLNQQSANKVLVTQFGAIDYLSAAFQKISKSGQKNDIQQALGDLLNFDEKGAFSGFKNTGVGLNKFLQETLKHYEFTPEQIAEVKQRLKEQAKDLGKTQTETLKELSQNPDKMLKTLFGENTDIRSKIDSYIAQQKAVENARAEVDKQTKRRDAYVDLNKSFDLPNQQIAAKAEEIAAALEAPTAALQQYKQQLIDAVTANPQLAASFGTAAQQIAALTSTIDAGRAKLAQMDQTISKMQGVSNFVNRYIGIYAIVRKVTQAVRSAFNNIKELDKNITNIAVVTNMSQEDLWGKIGEYTKMAQQYGVATKDVYTVSQLFYQQGLQTNQVMSLTTETLKMAKISGMGYEEAANAMTVAIRAFKVEMTDAQQVTDTYSALAAKFAVSSAEIANAMEKTASSAANVGMSLQSTSAFISVMTQTTRESAQNIGSALKSIISRYGEMKASPSKLLDVDGEEVAFNKVDTALKSVGISIKDSAGQFRDFDDVIMELAQKWDSLDNNTQRYIATVMAGNRQQSRFIALVSNYDELNRAMNVASTAENASIVQTAKTMESLESKTNQLKNAFSQLYLDLHLEEGLKGAYTWLTQIVTTIGKLGMLKGVIPTLLTVVNAGLGTKGLINTGIDAYKQKRLDLQGKVDIDTAKAKTEIAALVDKVETPHVMPIETKVNTTELDLAVAKATMLEQRTTTSSAASMLKSANSELTSAQIYSQLQQGLAANQLSTPELRAEFLGKLGITPNNTSNYSDIDNILARLAGAATTAANEIQNAGQTVAASANNVAAAQQGEAGASEAAAQSDTEKAAAGQAAAQVDTEKAATGQAAAQVDTEKAATGEAVVGANTQEAVASEEAATADIQEAAASNAAAQSDLTEVTKGNKVPTGSILNNQGFIPAPVVTDEKSHWYSRFITKDENGTAFTSTGMKAVSLTTGAVRMLAPLITGIGAAIKDKSTDQFEGSKIFTGLGNGLSGAATGAQIGMIAGPLGAAAGAMLGFATNGLAAVLDGFNYTLTERIATAKQEFEEASNESLKKQATVIDLSSTIDNLKTLKDAMYNSSEDMKAYKDAVSTAADSYPALISAYDSAGNAIIDLVSAETALSSARAEGAKAAKTAALKELDVADKELQLYRKETSANGTITNLQSYIGFKKQYPNILELSQQERAQLEITYQNNSFMQKSLLTEAGRRNKGEEGEIIPSQVWQELENLDSWIQKNTDTVKYSNIYDLTGINEEHALQDWNLQEIELAISRISSIADQALTKYNLLKDQANAAIGLDTLFSNINLDSSLSQASVSQLETVKNYQSLFNATLLNIKPTEFGDLNEWQNAENSSFSEDAYQLYQKFIDWYNSLGPVLQKEFENLDFTKYRSPEELISKFHITNDLADGFIEQFVQNTQANKDRILKAVYEYDVNGKKTNKLNSDMSGLAKFNYEKHQGTRVTEYNNAQKIADYIDNNQIVSEYADYFTTQLSSINKLAQSGYEELARNRLDVLSSFASKLSIIDSDTQDELFNTITNIDFSSYDAIKTAKESITKYGKEYNKTAIIQPILTLLDTAANELVFNVNTLASELSTKVETAAKEIDTLVGNAKSGISLDKALEALKTLNAKSGDTQYSFDKVFAYDAALNKYVYTSDGLLASMAAEEKDLNDYATRLKQSATDMEQIGQDTKKAYKSEKTFEKVEDLQQFIKTGPTGLSLVGQFSEQYETLAASFMADDSIKDKTWDHFLSYIQKKVEDDKLSAEQAEQVYNNYVANKSNQLYSSIDWNKLSLGTDYTGTNKILVKQLATELGVFDKEHGKWLKGYTEDNWEAIQDLYLDNLYGLEESSTKTAAKAAIKGAQKKAQSDQITTAITEMLAGQGSVLSDTSIALLNKTDSLSAPVNGVITAATDYVNSAITLYQAYSDSLLTVAEKNESYSSILTKQFERSNELISTLSSGTSLDISALAQFFTTFDLTLSNYYDAATKQWKEGTNLSGAFSTDMFGKTKIVDWNKFIKGISTRVNVDELKQTFEYKNAYASYVDGLITIDTQERELIKKNYDNAFSSITAWKPLNITELAKEENFANLFKNSEAALIQDGQLIINDAVEYARLISGYLTDLTTLPEEELYKNTGLTHADLAKDWKNAQTVITAVQDAWTGISENISSLNTDQIATLVEKGNFNLKQLDSELIFTKIGDAYSLNLEAYRQYLIKEIGGVDSYGQIVDSDLKSKIDQSYNKAAQALVNKINGLDWTKILDGTATLADQDTFKTGLTEALNSLGMDIISFYGTDGQFDYHTLMSDLKNQVSMGRLSEDIGNQIIDNIATTVASVRDTAFDEINSGMELFTAGTTSQADIIKFVQRYNKITGANASLDNLFNYDTITQSYTLTADAIKNYYAAQKDILVNLGMTEEAVAQYINDQIEQTISSEMDIAGFLSSNDISNDSKAAQTLMRQIYTWSQLTGKQVTEAAAGNYLKILVSGGEEAVTLLKTIKGEKNVTSDEVQAVYRAQINRLNSAMEQLDNGIQQGAIVTGETASALQLAGVQLTLLGDGTYLVNSVVSMVDAYAAIYAKMKTVTESTQADLNQAYAKLLTASEQDNIDAISALESGMGMDYSTFGQLIAKYGKGAWQSLEFTMQHQLAAGIKQLGNGKIKIVDFNRFAGTMGWQVGGEEYTKALESYNDSLISDMKESSEAVKEEIKNLTTAKTGQKINFTRIQSELQLVDSEFNKLFGSYGVKIHNGILEIINSAKLPDLARTITQSVQGAADLIPEQIAEIQDAVADALKRIADLIKKGITGSLTNSEALDLQSWATDQGLGKLDFTATSDGLKASKESAISLYNTLKQIDGLSARPLFNELSEQLAATDDHYKSVSTLIAYINELDSHTSSARAEQYAEELALAKEILAVRSTTEDDSFNFMSNKIPAAQQNPLNYAKNLTQAFQTFRDAFKTSNVKKNGKAGFMDYEDWYNIVTEFNNMAAVTGQEIQLGALTLKGDLESASNAIQAGASALTTVDTGELKVNLTDVGIGLSSGADALTDGVTKGVQGVAKAQVEALDALISMLEVIVAMEQLGDIDVDSDNHLNLGEIFQLDGEGEFIKNVDGLELYTTKYQNAAKTILDMAETNEDLQKGLDNVRVNNHTMREIFTDAIDGVKDIDIDAQMYQQLVDSFYQMAISGEYDENNIAASIQKIMDSNGVKQVSIDVGDKTYYLTGGTKFIFDWSNEEAMKAAEQALDSYGSEFSKKFNLKDNATIKDKLLELANQLENPDLTIEEKADINYTLKLGTGEIKIEQNKDKKEYTGTYKGKKITGNTYEAVQESIRQAVRMEENGFQFHFNEDGSVTGSITIGSVEVEVIPNEEDGYTYKTPYGTYDSKEEAYGQIAKRGLLSEIGEYTYTAEDGTKNTVSVRKAVGFDLIYSYYNDGEPHYIFDDHDFNGDYDSMTQYMTIMNQFDPTGTLGEWQNMPKNRKVITISEGISIQVDIESDGVKTSMHLNGQSFPMNSPQEQAAMLAYIEASKMDEFEDITKGDIKGLKTNLVRSIRFRAGEYLIDAEIDLKTGETKYSYTDGTNTYWANDLSDLQAYLDVKNDKAVEEIQKERVIHHIKKTEEGEIDIEIKIVGTKVINAKDLTDAGLMTQEEINALEVKLGKNTQKLENEVQAQASSIKILTEGAEIGLDTETLEVKDPIDIKVPAKSITITDANGASINLGSLTGSGTTNTGASGGGNEDNGGGLLAGITAEPFTAIAQALNNIKTDKIDAVASAANKVSPDKTALLAKESYNITSTKALAAQSALNSIVPSKAQDAQQALNNISIEGKTVDAIANIVVRVEHTGATGGGKAKGNIALAGGTPTLMGELGPELVVSQGRYFVVGQSGAEFVSLDKDAIVFNHKQTERLFANGAVSSRGKPFTNETNAISFAKGTGPAYKDGSNWLTDAFNNITNVIWTAKEALNGGLTDPNKVYDWGNDWSYTYSIITEDGGVSGHLWNAPIAEIELPSAAKGNVPTTGPAKASASAALAALKQLRAQWDALAGLSAKDLAGKGGGGGGGGGDAKAFIKELERWYNLLQEIAQLEKEINYQETLRSKIQSDFVKNGAAYYESQKKSMKDLEEQMLNHQNLAIQQENYFEKRRAELNSDSNPFSSLYTFDENGQLKYQSGKFEELSNMVGSDKYNSPNMTPEEQYDYIVNTLGISADYMKYDNSGNEIKFENGKPKDEAAYTSALQAFWDKIDSDKDEMQNLHDSIEEHKEAVLEAQQQQNEILREMQDNELELEGNIFDALVDMRERMIDEMEDEKNAYEDSANKMIDGLTDALNKEKEMYERQENQTETDRMRRRLAILLNSGGSSSEILDLQEQLRQRDRDAYFEATQQEIDNIKEASDAEIERLDAQIELEKEMLEYQKAHGLLWEEVRNIMTENDPQGIADYIVRNNSEYWSQSPTKTTKQMDDLLFSSTQWKKYQTDTDTYFKQIVDSITKNDGEKQWENYVKILKEIYGEDYEPDEEVKKAFLAKYGGTSDPNQAAAAGTEVVEAQEAEKEAADKKDDSGYAKNVGGQWMQGEGGRWWYKHSDGGYTKDNWEMINDKWYYFDKDGWMKTGWLEKDGKWYYFDDTSGEMLANTTKALNYNGKVENHTFNESGVWTGSTAINGSSNSKNYLITYRDTNGNVQSFYAESEASGKQTVKNKKGTFVSATKQEKKKAARGGYVNHGLYELGELGTETVLTASQTKVLRDNILSNRPNSLINLLKSYNEAYQGLSSSTYDQISNQNQESIVIEHAEVNMNVEEIANDYDAQRAGEQALQEMLRIARKTGATSIRR